MKTFATPLALLVAAPLLAQAEGGFRLTFTNDFVGQQNRLATWSPEASRPDRDPKEAWRQFNESLAITGNWVLPDAGSLTFGLTGRSTNFYQQRSDLTLDPADSRLYRKYLKYSQGGFTAQVGDFHALLGRGLVLSVLPIDKLLKERTIEGADVRYQGSWLELRALTGNIRTETRDQAWKVTGGECVVKWLEGPQVGIHRLGFHGARIEDAETAKTDELTRSLMHRRELRSVSLSGDRIGQRVSYYVESARLRWTPRPDDFLPLKEGEATYANVSFKAGPVYVLAEGRRYLRFETDLIDAQNTLNNPPLTDREDEKNNLVHSEIRRVMVQYALKEPDLAFFVSVGEIKENAYGDEAMPFFRFDPKTDVGHNVYGGFTAEDLWDRLTLSATYGVKDVLYRETRTDVAATLRFSKRWSLEVKHRDKRHTDPMTGEPNQERDLSVQLSRSPRFALYGMQQYRSSPGVNFKNRLMHSGGIRFFVSKTSYVDLSGGAIRGGLVCSGGQCRELPDFKGWKLATHFQF